LLVGHNGVLFWGSLALPPLFQALYKKSLKERYSLILPQKEEKMRTLILTLVLGLMLASPATGQTFVESQHVFAAGEYSPQLSGQVVKSGKKADLTVWFLVSEKWGEGLVGVSKSFKPWLWVGMLAGMETSQRPLRVSPEIWVGSDKASVFVAVERGGSGWWYKSVGTVKIMSRLEVGFHSQRFYGTGPLIKATFPGKTEVWCSAVSGPKFTFGVRKFF
jgi:hypothetical protein